MVGDGRVVFLDELHAHDPGDAMLLTQVILAVTAAGAPLPATSTAHLTGRCPTPVSTTWRCRW